MKPEEAEVTKLFLNSYYRLQVILEVICWKNCYQALKIFGPNWTMNKRTLN